MKNNNAFSLVEMMISLVAVSVLLAAFVPVITKRVKPAIRTASSSSSKISNNCLEKFSADCILCDGTKKCLICNKTCASGTFKDPDTCSCKSCSDIDPNCTTCSNADSCSGCADTFLLQNNACAPCPSGFYCTNGTKTKCKEGFYCINGTKSPCPDGKWSSEGSSSCNQNCPEGFYCKNGTKSPCPDGKWSSGGISDIASCTNCPDGFICNNGAKSQCESGTYVSSDAKSCTPCEVGYYCPDGKNKLTCESKTEKCILCDSKTGVCKECNQGSYLTPEKECRGGCPSWAVKLDDLNICVSKFNIGDFVNGVGISIPASANIEFPLDDGYCTTNSCCKKEVITSSYYTCDSAGGNYSGCNRTVCTWWAAKAICDALGARLPMHYRDDFTSEIIDLWSDYGHGSNNILQLCAQDSYDGFSTCGGGGSYGASWLWTLTTGSSGRVSDGGYAGGIAHATSVYVDVLDKSKLLSVRCIVEPVEE